MAGKNASTGWGLEDGTSGVLRSIAFATNYAPWRVTGGF